MSHYARVGRGIVRLVLALVALHMALFGASVLCWAGLKAYHSLISRPSSIDTMSSMKNFDDQELTRSVFESMKTKNRKRFQPILGFVDVPIDSEFVTTNAEGMRSLTSENGRDRAEVAFLGGSILWGVGNADHQIIPYRVREQLPDVGIQSFSYQHYTSRQLLNLLANHFDLLRTGETKVLVFFAGNEDIYVNSRKFHSFPTHRWYGEQKHAIEGDSSFLHHYDYFFLRQLREVNLVFFKDEDDIWTFGDLDRVQVEFVAREIINNWLMARAVAHAFGAEFLAVLEPVPFVGSPRIDNLQSTNFSKVQVANMNRVYDFITSELRNEPWFQDYSPIFDELEIYPYITHRDLSPDGNAMVAIMLAETLRQRLDHSEDRDGAGAGP